MWDLVILHFSVYSYISLRINFKIKYSSLEIKDIRGGDRQKYILSNSALIVFEC
jgi:hypothetical protein